MVWDIAYILYGSCYVYIEPLKTWYVHGEWMLARVTVVS